MKINGSTFFFFLLVCYLLCSNMLSDIDMQQYKTNKQEQLIKGHNINEIKMIPKFKIEILRG